MANPIKLWINRQTQSLSAYNGSPTAIPELFQYNTQDFEIGFVDPPLNPTSAVFTQVDMSAYTMRVAVGATPDGTAGQTPLALQTSWTWISARSVFTGSLSLNTAAIDTFLAGVASKQAYFEITTLATSLRTTMLQGQFSLRAVVDEGSSVAPTPSASYPTWDEAKATFVPFVGLPGVTIQLTSPDGVYGLIIGCNNDGSAKMDVIVL